jgi:hypothetical protein
MPQEETGLRVQDQVDPVQLDRLLRLIRDNYRKANDAASFLEERAGIANVYGITNLRDVLSHLATFLDPRLTPEQRSAQVPTAEEHLRRAVIEPYQIANEELLLRFRALYDNYKRYVLPIRDRHEYLATAPSSDEIEQRRRNIERWLGEGRQAKGRNLWDDEWEQGVASFIRAFDDLYDLTEKVETYWNLYRQHRRDRRYYLLTAWTGASIAGIAFAGTFWVLRSQMSTITALNWIASLSGKVYLAVLGLLGSVATLLAVNFRRKRRADSRLRRSTKKFIEYIGDVTLERDK